MVTVSGDKANARFTNTYDVLVLDPSCNGGYGHTSVGSIAPDFPNVSISSNGYTHAIMAGNGTSNWYTSYANQWDVKRFENGTNGGNTIRAALSCMQGVLELEMPSNMLCSGYVVVRSRVTVQASDWQAAGCGGARTGEVGLPMGFQESLYFTARNETEECFMGGQFGHSSACIGANGILSPWGKWADSIDAAGGVSYVNTPANCSTTFDNTVHSTSTGDWVTSYANFVDSNIFEFRVNANPVVDYTFAGQGTILPDCTVFCYRCYTDLNGDCGTDIEDLLGALCLYEMGLLDINGDGASTIEDLLDFLYGWENSICEYPPNGWDE